MSRSIGDVDFDLFYGRVPALKPRVDTWQVPGIDGVGAQLLGSGDNGYELRTVNYFERESDANSFIEDCESLQGTVNTVIDAFDVSKDDNLVVMVDTTGCKKGVIWNGSTDAVRVEIRWQLQRVGAVN